MTTDELFTIVAIILAYIAGVVTFYNIGYCKGMEKSEQIINEAFYEANEETRRTIEEMERKCNSQSKED